MREDDAWVPKISREQFERAYAARSHVTLEWLREHGRRAYPCVVCDYDGCEGWQMISRESAEFEIEMGRFGPEWLTEES